MGQAHDLSEPQFPFLNGCHGVRGPGWPWSGSGGTLRQEARMCCEQLGTGGFEFTKARSSPDFVPLWVVRPGGWGYAADELTQ